MSVYIKLNKFIAMTEIEFYERFVPEFDEYKEIYYTFRELLESNTLLLDGDWRDSDALVEDFKYQIVSAVYPYCIEIDESISDEVNDILINNADYYISFGSNNCYWINIEQLQNDIKELSDELDCECKLLDPIKALNEMNKNYPAKFIKE